jgi:hypothetical protein
VADLVVIERKDRDSGFSEIWFSLDQERGRLMILTSTLDSDTGPQTLKSLAMELCQRQRVARSIGQLRIEE